MDELFSNVVDKTKEKCVHPSLVSCVTCTTSFELYMLQVGYDTFAMIINFINSSWEPTHMIVRIFEVHNTTNVTMDN